MRLPEEQEQVYEYCPVLGSFFVVCWFVGWLVLLGGESAESRRNVTFEYVRTTSLVQINKLNKPKEFNQAEYDKAKAEGLEKLQELKKMFKGRL